MATLITSQQSHRGNTHIPQLTAPFKPWQRRLTFLQIVHWLVRGCIVGLILANLIFFFSRIVPWATAPDWALGSGLACPLLSLLAALYFRPDISHTTSILDYRLQLYDRLHTAWELRTQETKLARLQRNDALTQLQQYKPTHHLPLRFQRSTPILLCICSLILTLLIVLPNPMNDYLRQQANLQALINKQINSIEQIHQTIDKHSSLPPAEKNKIEQILKDLETTLHNATSADQAQQALANAQTQLNQLRDPQAANQSQAQTAAGQSLQSSNNSTLQAIGKALDNNDAQSLQQALTDLATQANQLDSQQRAQLAQALTQAANQADQNPALSSALQQLAKALSDGNASEITDAINAVQAAANQTSNGQKTDQTINSASQDLQNAANNLAASTDGTNSNQQKQGLSQGPNQNQGQNRGQGQGPGQGGLGQDGSGGNNNTGQQHGNNEQVYVPGQTGQGNSQQSTDNTSSAITSGNQISYQQIIQQYSQQAHDAMDNSTIAPNLKDLVQNYFNTLEGQK